MITIYIFLSALAILLIANIYLTIISDKKRDGGELPEIKSSIISLTQNLKDTETNLKGEFVTNRKENSDSATGLRTEVVNQLNKFTQTFSENLTTLTKSVEEKFTSFQNTIEENNKESRGELKDNLEKFKTELNEALKDYRERLREQFGEFTKQQQTQNVANTEKLGDLKKTLETSIKNLQEGNEKKLEEMRNTVDEKLQKTLETRLTQSFEIVNKSLESVQKGLGAM